MKYDGDVSDFMGKSVNCYSSSRRTMGKYISKLQMNVLFVLTVLTGGGCSTEIFTDVQNYSNSIFLGKY